MTIRNIDPATKAKPRIAAAVHGRSMEEEVRTIVRNVLAQPAGPGGLGSRIQARFAAIGVELGLPSRSQAAREASRLPVDGRQVVDGASAWLPGRHAGPAKPCQQMRQSARVRTGRDGRRIASRPREQILAAALS